MRFCPWYPLTDAHACAPAEPGMLQLRLADGLIDYPRGKSAMVHYALVPDVRAAAIALARPGLLCRHLEGGDPRETYARLLAEFERRFGAPPGGVS